MSSTAPAHDPADRALQRDEDAQYYRQVLHEFVEIGARLARAIDRQAAAAPGAASEQAGQSAPASAPDLTIPFERVARTVRRTIALARKLSEPDRAPSPARQAAEGAPSEFAQRRATSREHSIRAAEDATEHESDGAEALYADLHERLDAPDLDDPDLDDGELDEQALADFLALISRDTGLGALSDSELAKRRTPADARNTHASAARLSTAQPATRQNPRPVPAAPPFIRTGAGPPREP